MLEIDLVRALREPDYRAEINEELDGTFGDTVAILHAADEIEHLQELILTRARVAPKVKPLEWECRSLKGWKRGRYAAKSPIGAGWAAYIERVDGGWKYAGVVYSSAIDGLEVALDCAKIQAQEDYDKALLSALEI